MAVHSGSSYIHEVELILLEGGTFWMGTADGEGYPHERPRHQVTLAPFYLAKTPVTNAQYAAYLEANPRAPKPEYWGDRQYNQAQQPVVGICWTEAQAYCEWAGLVLPTEAQWEYACRAGTDTHHYSGNSEEDLARVGWYEANSSNRLHAVAELPPNAFGLYDMHGNVWEWCLDEAGTVSRNDKTRRVDLPSYSVDARASDGLRDHPEGDGYRIVRGGGWYGQAAVARSAFRFAFRVGFRDRDFGFRPALVPTHGAGAGSQDPS